MHAFTCGRLMIVQHHVRVGVCLLMAGDMGASVRNNSQHRWEVPESPSRFLFVCGVAGKMDGGRPRVGASFLAPDKVGGWTRGHLTSRPQRRLRAGCRLPPSTAPVTPLADATVAPSLPRADPDPAAVPRAPATPLALRRPAHAPQRLRGHPNPVTLRHRAACARARPG